MRASLNQFGGQLGESALDEVQPRAVSGGEVQGEAGAAQEPALDRGSLVGRGVVEDYVDIEWSGTERSMRFRNRRKLLSPMP